MRHLDEVLDRLLTSLHLLDEVDTLPQQLALCGAASLCQLGQATRVVIIQTELLRDVSHIRAMASPCILKLRAARSLGIAIHGLYAPRPTEIGTSLAATSGRHDWPPNRGLNRCDNRSLLVMSTEAVVAHGNNGNDAPLHVGPYGNPRLLPTTWDVPREDRPDDLMPMTLEELTLALSHRIGLPEEEVAEDANMLMDIFGFDDRVIDNVLDRAGRQLFYALEEEGMLSTDREETTLHDGREWRTHYWSLRKNVIKRFAEEHRKAGRERRVPKEDDVYTGLPRTAWAGRQF